MTFGASGLEQLQNAWIVKQQLQQFSDVCGNLQRFAELLWIKQKFDFLAEAQNIQNAF